METRGTLTNAVSSSRRTSGRCERARSPRLKDLYYRGRDASLREERSVQHDTASEGQLELESVALRFLPTPPKNKLDDILEEREADDAADERSNRPSRAREISRKPQEVNRLDLDPLG